MYFGITGEGVGEGEHKDLKLLSQHLLSGSGPQRFDLSLGGQPKHTGHINQHGERAWHG